jgi:glutamate dehydrogenase/leucine dehydrogenase/CBS domain-containing protein
MIPEQMRSYLKERLPERTLEVRLLREGSRRYLEFGPLDVDRLARLGIEVDSLGPRLVVCMWDEESPLEIGGYLVVDNLAMGRPSMGGIRMLPTITPQAIHNLARGMTLKNAAADLPYGGGKSGILAGRDLSPENHRAVVRGFAHLIHRYRDIYLPGPDVGTNDDDMGTIAIEFGLDSALSKPAEMGGNCIDELGGAAGGVVIALQALLAEMPRLRALPQFENLQVPSPEHVTVLIQGFGAVGAHAARLIGSWLPGARVTGISDETGYLYGDAGLPIKEMFKLYQEQGPVAQAYYQHNLAGSRPGTSGIKFSTDPGDLLRESAFCLVPAAPVANYLDTDPATHPTMTVDRMGRWMAIVEGANTYSPDRERRGARARMERAVYRGRGVMIATDYLVNSGGVIFAAQEKLIKTPDHLRFPGEILRDRKAVDRWLADHAAELAILAEQRRVAAEAHRDEVIRRNIRELIDLLLTDSDMLPSEAAERVSVRRIASRESDRTAADIMESIPTISNSSTVKDAAGVLVDRGCPILAVVSEKGRLAGVVTDWDITRATALGSPDDQPLENVMTRQVVAASPEDSLLEVIRKLEYHEISAMPVVSGERVLGMVSTDLLTRRSLLRLLQSETV